MHRTTVRAGDGPLEVPAGRRRHRYSIAGAALVCSAAMVATTGAGSALAAVGASSAASPAGGTPSWVSRATKLGALAPDATVRLSVVLAGHDDAGAEAAALAVSSPSSSSYGAFLTSAAYTQKYAATNAEVASVTTWLKGAGFAVESVPDNHLWVRVAGTPAAVQKAFGVTLDSYSLNGRTLHAPSGTATIPAVIQPLVAGLAGLSSSVRSNQPQLEPGDQGDLAKNRVPAGTPRRGIAPTTNPAAPPAPAFVNSPPCSSYWGQKQATTAPTAFGKVQPYVPCGYTPAQLRGAYGVDKIGVKGAGITVAITDAYNSPTILQDANTYAVKRGDKAFAAGQFREIKPAAYQYGFNDTVNGDLCGEQGWYGEETLDVEAVHGLAPAAKVLYVGAASCDDGDLVDALNTIVAGHQADLISNSWGSTGEPDPTDPTQATLLAAYKRVFIQAALTGIGVFYSSGDNGDEVANAGVRVADFPATSPWVTAVGGTSIGIGSSNNYLFEQAWGTGRSILTSGAWAPAPPGTYIYGGGGGVSQVFPQPWYQKGIVPKAISQYFGGAPGRAIPDVAAIGDPSTGFLVGQTQTFSDGTVKYSEYRIGGTSLASPVMAGIQALSDQAAGRPHGFINPALYELKGTRAIHDITKLASPQGVVRVDYVNGENATGGLRTTFRSFQQLGTLTSAPGYDDTTGVGTPNGFLYVYGLGQISTRVEPYAVAKAG